MQKNVFCGHVQFILSSLSHTAVGQPDFLEDPNAEIQLWFPILYNLFLFQIGLIGSRPQESKGSVIRALLRQTLSTTQWGIKVKQVSGKTVSFTVMPSAKAMIGQYEVFVETIMKNTDGSKLVFRYKDDDKVCVLFNAWCKG